MWEDLRLDGLAEWPPLHLGLEAHVGDLQAEAVPVHGGGGVVPWGLEESWPSIDWEAGGGGTSGLQLLSLDAFPTFHCTGGSTCCRTLSRPALSYLVLLKVIYARPKIIST